MAIDLGGMAMTVKVIIMDIDGTLLNDDKQLTEKTRTALLKAQDQGALLVLASGRPTSGLRKLAKQLKMDQHHGLFVCFNGSKVIDCQSNEVLFNQAISVEDSKAVLEHLKKFKARPMFDKGEYMYVNDVFDNFITYKGQPFNVMKYEARSNNYLLCEKRDLAAFVDFEINKILTYGDPEYLQQHYREMMEPFQDRLNCMFTADFYFEFTAKGIDKAKALDVVLISKGYKREEMIAFGDAQNDKTMIQYVGCGIAMANASEELKAVADDVTLSNNDDGIAFALAKYMPELDFGDEKG